MEACNGSYRHCAVTLTGFFFISEAELFGATAIACINQVAKGMQCRLKQTVNND